MSQDIEQEHLRAHKALELLPTYLVIITKQIHPTLLMPQANKSPSRRIFMEGNIITFNIAHRYYTLTNESYY